ARDRVAPPQRGVPDLGKPRVVRPSNELIQREGDASACGVIAIEVRPELVLEDALAHSDEPGLIDRRGGRVRGEGAVPGPDQRLRVASGLRGRGRGKDRVAKAR